MSWPADFSEIVWEPGQIISQGGKSYLMPFDLGQKAMEESKVQPLPDPELKKLEQEDTHPHNPNLT